MTTTADTPTALGSPADQAAIAALTQKVIAAWAYADADGFANVFTEDGTMILPGLYKKGRDEIRAHMASEFQGRYKDTQVTGKPIDLRFLTPDSAVLLSAGGVLEKGESEVSEASAIRAGWIVVKRDGTWQLAAYINSPRH